MLVTVAETEPTDTPEGDHLKVLRSRERRVSRTYTAHKALLDPTILRSIKDWNLPRDEEADEVGRLRGDPPVAASATSPKVVRPHEGAQEDSNRPAPVWRRSLQEIPVLEHHASDASERRHSLPETLEQPHTSDKFMRPNISKTENRMYVALTCPVCCRLPPTRT